jgi:hypothetical protein
MSNLKNVHRYIPGFRRLSANSMVIAATYYGASAFIAAKYWHWGLALLALPFLVFNLLELSAAERGKLPLMASILAGGVVLLGSAAGIASGVPAASGAVPATVVVSATPRPCAAPSFSATAAAAPGASAEQAQYAFVAAKGGKVYHRPDCPSAKRIKPENLIGFASREEAEAAGLAPCERCKP